MGYLGNLRFKVAQRQKAVAERKAVKRRRLVKEMAVERKNLAVETKYYSDKAKLSKARTAHRRQKYAPVLGAVAGARKALKGLGDNSTTPSKDLFPSNKSADQLLGMNRAVPKKKVVPKKRKLKKVYYEYK